MPRLGPRTTKAVSTVVVALLAVAVWWLQQDGDDHEPARGDSSVSASPTADAARTADAPTTDGPTTDAPPAAAPTTDGPTTDGQIRNRPDQDDHGIRYVDLSALPREAAETVRLIDRGGPFPYPGKDGSTFGNFEGLLPAHKRGYYAEYTVETPGLDHRGARRIIAGDGGELYWTEDHYESFARIR